MKDDYELDVQRNRKNFIDTIRNEQEQVSMERNSHDYAQELFELSRQTPNSEESVTVTVERAWAGDVAAYIVQLENAIKAREVG